MQFHNVLITLNHEREFSQQEILPVAKKAFLLVNIKVFNEGES